jgi:hypothetical protein
MSCKSQWEKEKERAAESVKKYITAKAKEDNTKIDSINILQVDTLTPKKDSINVLYALYSFSDYFPEKLDYYKNKMQNNLQYMRAFSGYGDLSFWKEEFDEAKKKSDKLLSVWEDFTSRTENINRLDSLGKLDSITKSGIRVLFNLRGSKNMEEVRGDSLILLLNNQFHIIDRNTGIIDYYREILRKIE